MKRLGYRALVLVVLFLVVAGVANCAPPLARLVRTNSPTPMSVAASAAEALAPTATPRPTLAPTATPMPTPPPASPT
ncbi:MAG: DUF3048 domain-containing protein, partial [Anaerolineae bacterium]|nr:DUF3048 domain-containing protein [Anaerolineae bacterium]